MLGKMDNKNFKRQIVLALAPLFVLCFAVFVNTVPGSLSKSMRDKSSSAIESMYSSNEQKDEAPSREPIYVSVIKFIINCNPFQKETQQ